MRSTLERIWNPIAIQILLYVVRDLLLMLNFLDRQLVQPNLTSNLLATGSVFATGLVSEETVDLKAANTSQIRAHASKEPLYRNSPVLMSCS